MGLAGAGTNNSRIAGLLRTLATFYRSEPAHLFVVRLAQGLLHMGKGLVTLNPFHSDRLLLSPVALAGLLTGVMCFLDVKAGVHGKFHFLLLAFAMAMNPRWCITVDEVSAPAARPRGSACNAPAPAEKRAHAPTRTPVCLSHCSHPPSQTGAELKVEIRVGTAVETVGQAGKPKTITGFQTHTTPVVMSVKDRGELVDDAYLTVTNVVEGVVVLKPNPAAKAKKGGGGGAAGKK